MADTVKRWKRADIHDLTVVSACRYAHGIRGERSLDVLVRYTGAPQKVCFRAMERAHSRGLIEYGTSLACAWPADAGESLNFGRWLDLNILVGQPLSSGPPRGILSSSDDDS